MFCCTGSGRTDTYGCSKAKEHSQDQCQKQHYDSFTFLHSSFPFLIFCPRSCSSACQPFSVMITADGGISQTDYCPLITCQCGFYHDGALHTFSLEFASDFIIAFDISLEMECICRTSATTVETCEAVFAVFLCVNVASAEFLLDFRLCDAFVYISHEILFFTNKLVTWVKITPGCYSQVLCS